MTSVKFQILEWDLTSEKANSLGRWTTFSGRSPGGISEYDSFEWPTSKWGYSQIQ